MTVFEQRFRRILSAVLLLIMSAAAAADIACLNRGGDALPADAFPVPVSRWRELQKLLDEHGSISLDPAGDYRRATGIHLRSGQGIFGAAGTRIGRLIVTPGTSGSVVSGVVPDALEFPSSRRRTHDNCFERFGGRVSDQQPLRLVNVVVENNLFLDGASILIDTSAGGRVANNRFIRTLVHGAWPVLKVEGRNRDSPDRNVFLWMNVLGPQGDGIILRRQAELNLLAFDAENWNHNREGRMPAMLSASEMGTLRTFIAHGGDPKQMPDAFMDVDARRFELTATHLIRAAEPAIRLRPGVEEFVDLLSGGATYSEAAAESRLVAYRNWSSGIEAGKIDAPPARASSAAPWEAPSFADIPAPAGKGWREARLKAPDMRGSLQERLDREGVVRLPAGVHVISGPLRLRRGQGIIGAGAGRTAIVARSDDIDLIVGDDHHDSIHATDFVLMDVTLQGGRSGLRHDRAGAGKGAQFNLVHLSHVVFRDQVEAGIVLDGIYGWDNNLIDHVAFLHMPVGIRQIPNPAYAGPARDGDIPGMNYMDKNVFFRCRFQAVGIGMQLLGKRANGLNACIECRFSDYSISAVELENNLSTLFANSDFIGSGSAPVIRSNQLLGVVASRFSGLRDKAVVLDADVACEDCRFTSLPGATPVVVAAQRRISLVNSRVGNATIPADVLALLIDTEAGSANGTGRLRYLAKRQWTTLVDGTPAPTPSLLVQWQQ